MKKENLWLWATFVVLIMVVVFAILHTPKYQYHVYMMDGETYVLKMSDLAITDGYIEFVRNKVRTTFPMHQVLRVEKEKIR